MLEKNSNNLKDVSHTRTVVRECCKNDKSVRGRVTVDPRRCVGEYVGDTYLPSKFYADRIRGFASAHARLRAPNCLVGYFLFLGGGFFLSPLTYYSQDATTGIDAKYVKRRGSAQRCAFSGSQKQSLTFTLPFPKKHFRARFLLYSETFARKWL